MRYAHAVRIESLLLKRLSGPRDKARVALLRRAGGNLRTTTRCLGDRLGRPAATVHGELRGPGVGRSDRAERRPRGTYIVLAGAARAN